MKMLPQSCFYVEMATELVKRFEAEEGQGVYQQLNSMVKEANKRYSTEC